EPAPAFGTDPWLVGRAQLDALSRDVTETVEVVISSEAQKANTDGMVFSELERPAAGQVINAAAHEEISAALAPVIDRLA
ncbi:MAG: DUF6473 family protein, partial [Pseudomonadota bacterium]